MGYLYKAVIVSLIALLIGYGSAQCAVTAARVAPQPGWELLIFEHRDCTYCRFFRRDVLPYYRQAVPGDAVPLRFVDLKTAEPSAFALKGRIEAVPTAVLMKDGEEIGRIVGYWGRDTFFSLLSHLLSRME